MSRISNEVPNLTRTELDFSQLPSIRSSQLTLSLSLSLEGLVTCCRSLEGLVTCCRSLEGLVTCCGSRKLTLVNLHFRQDNLAKSAKLIVEKLRLCKLRGGTDPLIAALGGGGGSYSPTLQ